MIGEVKFKGLIKIISDKIQGEDYDKALLLLDKVKDYRGVLTLMIKSLQIRTRPRYFCSYDLKGLPEAFKVEKRVTEVYKLMLDSYKKGGIEKENKDLFDILNTLDKICQSFDRLALTPDKITKELMEQSLKDLQTVCFLPKKQSEILD